MRQVRTGLREISSRKDDLRFTFEFDKTLTTMIVVTAAISFLKVVFEGNDAMEILKNGLAVGFIIVSLAVWSFLESKTKNNKEFSIEQHD